MAFRITGLDPAPFAPLFGLSDAELCERGVRRCRVDAPSCFPDRIEMRDLEVGETALLLHYEHHRADSPFRASHAIFVREGATQPYDVVDTVPEVMHRRLLSLRAFDGAGDMIDADVVDGPEAEGLIARLLANPDTQFIHAHYAKRGCYAGLIRRA